MTIGKRWLLETWEVLSHVAQWAVTLTLLLTKLLRKGSIRVWRTHPRVTLCFNLKWSRKTLMKCYRLVVREKSGVNNHLQLQQTLQKQTPITTPPTTSRLLPIQWRIQMCLLPHTQQLNQLPKMHLLPKKQTLRKNNSRMLCSLV
jgi:hypothetical protein